MRRMNSIALSALQVAMLAGLAVTGACSIGPRVQASCRGATVDVQGSDRRGRADLVTRTAARRSRPWHVVDAVWRSGARRARSPRRRVEPDNSAGGRPVPTGPALVKEGRSQVLPDGHRSPAITQHCFGEPVGFSSRALRR